MHHNDFRQRILNVDDDPESIIHWYNNANVIFLTQVWTLQ